LRSLGLRIPGRTHRHTDARGEKQFTTVDREGPQHLLEQAIRNDLRVADGFQAVEQHRKLVAFNARDDVVAAKGRTGIRDAKAGLQTTRGSGQQWSRRLATEIDEQQRVVEPLVLLCPRDRVRETIDQQQAVRQAGQLVGDGLDSDVRVGARQAQRRPAVVAHDRDAAHGPAIPAVLVPETVPEFELVTGCRARRIDIPQHVRQLLGVNPVQPLVGRVADFMLLAAGQRNPSRGEVNPV
jgi:hypothetical protein